MVLNSLFRPWIAIPLVVIAVYSSIEVFNTCVSVAGVQTPTREWISIEFGYEGQPWQRLEIESNWLANHSRIVWVAVYLCVLGLHVTALVLLVFGGTRLYKAFRTRLRFL